MGNVLVIGNAESVYTKEYIKKVHKPLGNKVYLTSYTKLSEQDREFYETMNVTLLDVAASNKAFRMLKIRNVLYKFAKRMRGQITKVDIQQPPSSVQAYILTNVIKILNCSAYVTFWGSDLLRLNSKGARRIEEMLDLAQSIDMVCDYMKQVIESFYGTKYRDKYQFVAFGITAFEEIDKCEMTVAACKEHFGLSQDKTIIQIGHNGRKEQQQIKVIEQLANLPDREKAQIQLFLHMGYNVDKEYLEETKKCLEESGIDYVILEKFLNFSEIAILRKAIDIMIHAQVSDAVAGSIREAIYAGSILVNGAWLRFDEFDEWGVDYIKYSDFTELPAIITSLVANEVVINRDKNKEILYKEYSWDSKKDEWVRMLNA